MSRRRAWLIPLGAAAAVAFGVVRHRGGAMGRNVGGGTLVGNAARYDAFAHRLLLRSLFDGIGEDLDPAMIELARANAAAGSDGDTPSFVVGNVSALSFPDDSFDLVVSTLSMHHWTDPSTALNEVGRVLRPNGRALVWDLRGGFVPMHRRMPDPASHSGGTTLSLASSTAWRWPWRFSLLRRVELVRQKDAFGRPHHGM